MKIKGGFTLIELLVVIVILAIVALIAIPGFSRWLPNYRLRVATRDVFSNFQHARLTAVKRHSLCAITFSQALGAQPDPETTLKETGTKDKWVLQRHQ